LSVGVVIISSVWERRGGNGLSLRDTLLFRVVLFGCCLGAAGGLLGFLEVQFTLIVYFVTEIGSEKDKSDCDQSYNRTLC
jgi:hypothetical protein